MHWPIQPVEVQRRFAPAFCPWRDCSQHTLEDPRRLAYAPAGGYFRSDGRRVPRYRCLACSRTFSKQTFAVSYFLKRPELLAPICAGLQAGSAHRQLARSLGCAPSTVTRLSARLGRHALLLNATALLELGACNEPLVLDHFESIVRTQDYPVGVGTVVVAAGAGAAPVPGADSIAEELPRGLPQGVDYPPGAPDTRHELALAY